MPLTPDTLDYYEGPSDPAELRLYLNVIIRALNILTEYVLAIQQNVQPAAPVITSGPYTWDGTESVLLVNTATGPITIVTPAGLAPSGYAVKLLIIKVGTDGNAATVQDGSGNVLAFLSNGGQAFAEVVSTSTSVYAGSVT